MLFQCITLKKKILARIIEVAVLVRSENLTKKQDPPILALEHPKMKKEKKKQLKYHIQMKLLDQNKLKRALQIIISKQFSSAKLIQLLFHLVHRMKNMDYFSITSKLIHHYAALKRNKSSSLLLICLITNSFHKLSINYLRKERFFHLILPFLPQSLLNSLRNNFFKMTDFNILLFFQTNP